MRTYTSRDWKLVGALQIGYVLEDRIHRSRIIVESVKYVDVENNLVLFLDKNSDYPISLSKSYVRANNLPFSFKDMEKVIDYVKNTSICITSTFWEQLVSIISKTCDSLVTC